MSPYGILSSPAISLIWAGVCLGICVEARVKFSAPSLTREVGLDVGRTVFRAILRVEKVLCFVTWALYFQQGFEPQSYGFTYLALATGCAFLQWFWLSPLLNQRAEIFIKGGKPPSSYQHFYYVLLEGCKIASLLAGAHSLLKN
eukprot:Sdes_comp18734_c0_seq3m9090